eukprot:Hpha_TRINITY_DN13899_c0_g2::TRINITY_DN13899_c0_g2_i2::g.69603::m.69603
MRPFEAIRFKHPTADFAPNSSKVRPGSKLPAPRPNSWQPKQPAVGHAGRAVQLKKQLGPGWDTASPSATHPPKRPVLLPGGPKVILQGGPPSPQAVSPQRTQQPKSPGAAAGYGPSGLPSPGRVAAAAARGERPQSPLAYQLADTYPGPVSPHAFISPGPPLAYRPPGREQPEPPLPANCAPPPRPEGLTVQELCPQRRAPPNLRQIDLGDAVPDPDAALVATPRFGIPPTVEVEQGSGPVVMEGFARNLDEDTHGADQALCFNVWAHSADVFADTGLPTVDCTGTLFFTPSAYFGGSTLVTLTLSDNAAVSRGEVKTSLPQTFTIHVRPSPVPVPRPVDWRGHSSKRGMPVAVVPEPPAVVQAPVEPEPIVPNETKWTFPPGNPHKLRTRRRVKGHQDLSFRLALGVCPLERILAPQMVQDRLALSGGGRIDVSQENAKTCSDALAKKEAEVGDNKLSPALLPPLGALAAIYFSWGGQHASRSGECLRRIVDIYGAECGITGDDLSSVPQASSLVDPSLDADRLRRQSLEERVGRTEQYAEALMDLGRFYLLVGDARESVRVLRIAQEVVRRVHGEDHRMFVRGAISLAESLSHLGLVTEAYDTARSMLAAAQLTYSMQDPAYAGCLHLHAYCALRAPSVIESPDALRQALDQHHSAHNTRRSGGATTGLVGESLLYIADACLQHGLWEEAGDHCQEAVDVLREAPEDDAAASALLPAALMCLGHTSALRSRYKGPGGAQEHFEDAAVAAEVAEQEAGILTGLCRLALASFMVVQGADGPVAGTDALGECEVLLSKHLPDTHPLVARCRAARAGALLQVVRTLTKHERRKAQEALAECASLLRRSRESLQQWLCERHTLRAFVDEVLCDLALHRRQQQEALAHCNSARDEREGDVSHV